MYKIKQVLNHCNLVNIDLNRNKNNLKLIFNTPIEFPNISE